MAEQFADLVERSAFSKQIGGQCVAEEMCTFASGVDASADQRPPDDCGNETVMECAKPRIGARCRRKT